MRQGGEPGLEVMHGFWPGGKVTRPRDRNGEVVTWWTQSPSRRQVCTIQGKSVMLLFKCSSMTIRRCPVTSVCRSCRTIYLRCPDHGTGVVWLSHHLGRVLLRSLIVRKISAVKYNHRDCTLVTGFKVNFTNKCQNECILGNWKAWANL